MITEKSKPERRSAELKFLIGTIVTHKCNDDTIISISILSGIAFNTLPDNYSNMSCKNVENCTDSMCLVHKPYYIILYDTNEYCHVRQENISICSSIKWVHHDEMGRYFSKYERTYYVPNEMLASDYPCDVAIINEMMRNL